MLCIDVNFAANTDSQGCFGAGAYQLATRNVSHEHGLVRSDITDTNGQRRLAAQARCAQELDK